MDELQGCPHCGAIPRLHTTRADADGPGVSNVRCDNCGAQGGTPFGRMIWRCAHDGLTEAQGISAHDAEAVRLWNTRAT